MSEQIGDFLEAFERAAFAASTHNSLSEFRFYTSCKWNPNYSFPLPFTQLTILVIESSCDDGCSSNVDNEIIMNLARAMPTLEILQLGDLPCQATGVTVKGLVALAHHRPDLTTLRVHFEVHNLIAPPTIAGITSNARSTPPRRDCALREFQVGHISVSAGLILTVTLTLPYIFPHLENIDCVWDVDWATVVKAIRLSRQIVDYSSKNTLSAPRITLMIPF